MARIARWDPEGDGSGASRSTASLIVGKRPNPRRTVTRNLNRHHLSCPRNPRRETDAIVGRRVRIARRASRITAQIRDIEAANVIEDFREDLIPIGRRGDPSETDT